MKQLVGKISGESPLKGNLSVPQFIKTSEGGVNIFNGRTPFDFPNRGNPNVMYVATEENAIYRWDEDSSKYYCVGRDYTEIDTISGGKA